jgi:hypothetical protein
MLMMAASSTMPMSDVVAFVVMAVLVLATVCMQVLTVLEPQHK